MRVSRVAKIKHLVFYVDKKSSSLQKKARNRSKSEKVLIIPKKPLHSSKDLKMLGASRKPLKLSKGPTLCSCLVFQAGPPF